MRPCGLSDPCAIWCETVDSNHAEREVRVLPHTLRAAALNGAVPKSRIEAVSETEDRAKPGTCKQKRRKMPRRDTFRRLRASVCLLAFPMIQFYTMR